MTSIIIAIFLGVIYKTRWFNNLLAILKINRTTNDSIWNDAIGENAWVVVQDKKSDLYYGGQFRYCNKSGDNIMVAISTYYVAQKTDKKFTIIEEYPKDVDRLLLLNINEYDKIIISPTDPLDYANDLK